MTATTLSEVTLPEAADLVRAHIALASRAIPNTWPIATFIALNPLGGWEDRPFVEGVAQAEREWRCRGYLPLSAYHAAYRAGRITQSELAAAIQACIVSLDVPEALRISGQTFTLADLLEKWVWDESPAQDAARPATLADWCPEDKHTTLVEVINNQLITWCAVFLDEGQAAWTMPHRERGLWACWRSLAEYDRFWAIRGLGAALERLAQLPNDPHAVIAALLQRMEVPAAEWAGYLTRHLTQLPGWASAIRWREAHPEHAIQMPCTIAEYLAIRLFYEAELVVDYARQHWGIAGTLPAIRTRRQDSLPQPAAAETILLERLTGLPEGSIQVHSAIAGDGLTRFLAFIATGNRAQIWQVAYEQHYRTRLIEKLQRPLSSSNELPEAQAIFCIDARSEGLRRQCEASGRYETFGAAGFFGLPITFRAFAAAQVTNQCPALVSPAYAVSERASGPGAKRWRQSRRRWQVLRTLSHALRTHVFSPFAFVEAVGGLFLFPLVARTLWPRTTERLREGLRAKVAPLPATSFDLAGGDGRLGGMSLATQVRLAADFLRSMGLTQHFAPLVLICGHGSHSTNNPYAAALDCGACGGQPGGPNARVAAQILNDPQVRAGLATDGIHIPTTTRFLAGEHTTTTDTVTIFADATLPTQHRPAVARLTAALADAGRRNAMERATYLPGAPRSQYHTSRHVATRATDWAQLVPEWGLARNAAFICGRRELTQGIDLQQRVFLHSYDPAQDPDGHILEGILTAPLIVAAGINLQYYFSTVDPQAFGSGNKLFHTVTGTLGVMSGRHSDLRLGLPTQSVQNNGHDVHEPMRLVAIVDAPVARVAAILARQPELAQVVRHDWITLLVRDPMTGCFVQAVGHEWVPIS